MDAVALMGRIVKDTAAATADRDGLGCAKLVVFCNAVEDNPFMAGAFHGVGEAEKVINVGVSGPGVVCTALKAVKGQPFDVVAETVKKTAFRVTRMGQLVAQEASRRLDTPFGIVDLSLAPTPAIGDSVARILEEMGLEVCGTHGTTAALALLNDAVKKGGVMASSSVGGLSGAFIPVSEDEGMIAAVGGRTAVEDQTGIDVRRVDLAGRTLLPAFLDAHSHFTAVANQFLQVSLEGCTSWADMQDRIRDYIRRERIPAGQWVTAQGYDHNLLSERRHPDRLCLDAAAPDNPVVICHQSGHMGVFNTAALERLGVTAQTPAPAGGVIGRENGTLTGYMEENAFLEFQKRVPMRPLESFLAAYRKAQDLYASYGITTVQEGLLRRELVPLYQALLADGSLKLDVVAYGDPEGAEAARQAFPESVRQYHRRFKLGGYKMFLDGSPQGRTAWLRRPYQGEQEYRGYGTLTDAEVLDMVRRAGTDGMQLLAHCNGDAACAQYLAALDAAAREGVDLAALRPVMIHAQLLGRDQLPEVRRLGVIPSFFVAHVYHWGDVHLENLGPGRAEAISPAGSAAEQGIPFTFHQDAPVIRPDMLETVWCAVNRVTRQGRVLGREERVDVRTALEAVTVHAAYQYFEETDKGTLAPGKQADLVILDRDPLAVPQEELRDIRVLETWKDGVPIFCREA